jgi:predicted RNA-binding protein with PIN domain
VKPLSSLVRRRSSGPDRSKPRAGSATIPYVPRWLVDGMNVIGSRPDGWWRDRAGAVRALAVELDRFADATGEQVTVVFDGQPRDVRAKVTVRFAPGGRNAADDEIARLVAADDAPGDLLVVTSDADLAARVRTAGASVKGAGTFRRRLDDLDADG